MIFRFFSLLLLILLGCGGEGLSQDGDANNRPPNDDTNGDGVKGRHIELLSEPYLVLEYSSSSTIRIRLRDEHGAPIPDHPVFFSLHGRANNSSLSRFDVRSDEGGVASVEVTAGGVESTFSVRVAAEGIEPIYIAVTVSIGELAAITVLPRLEDVPELRYYRAYIMSDLRCDSASVDLREYDRLATIPIELRRLYFPFLPVHREYVIAIEALDAEGGILALVCSEVRLDEPDLVHRASLAEGRVKVGARYKWSAEFDLRPHLAEAIIAANGLIEAVGDGLSEAEYALHMLLAALAAGGEMTDYDAVFSESDALIPLIAAALGDFGPREPLRQLIRRTDALRKSSVHGELSFDEGASGEATVEGIRFFAQWPCDAPDNGPEDEEACPLKLLNSELDSARLAELNVASLGADSAELTLGLPVPALGLETILERYRIAVSLAAGEEASNDALVSAYSGCDAFGGIEAFEALIASCDGICLRALCEEHASALYSGGLASLHITGSLLFEGPLRYLDPSFTTHIFQRIAAPALTLSALEEPGGRTLISEGGASLEASLALPAQTD